MGSVMRVLEVSNLESTAAKGWENQEVKQREEFNSGEALSTFKSSNATLSVPQTEAALLESGWPWAGNIDFNDVSMRYNSASPLVLKNLTVNIPAGSTLGVVGRTGSGKSSLLLTIFRIVEVEGVGSI